MNYITNNSLKNFNLNNQNPHYDQYKDVNKSQNRYGLDQPQYSSNNYTQPNHDLYPIIDVTTNYYYPNNIPSSAPYIARNSLNSTPDVLNAMNSIKKSPIDDNQMRNKGKNTLRNNVGKSDPFNEFSLNVSDLSLAKCPVHKEMREIILLSEVDKFQKFERICVQCESEIKRNFPGKVNSELYNVIIEQNKEKIKKIKTMNVNIDLTDNSNLGQKALNFSNESIEPIADEILDLVDSLNNQIITKLVDNGDKLKFQELKEFINNMPFNNLGDPNLNLIGENQSLKAKYVALAIFLLKHNTDSGLNLSKSINSVNLSKLLIEYLKEITRLRKHIMSKFTDWLRFLTGDFYDYIFTLDRNDIDFNFRNSFQIDFINEEDLMRMKSLLELELIKRDDKLSSLFAEKEQFRL